MNRQKALFSQLFRKHTFLTSQKSTRSRRHFVPKTVSSRFKIETLLAGPLQTKSLLLRGLSQNLPQDRRHSDVKIAIMLETTNWTNEDLFRISPRQAHIILKVLLSEIYMFHIYKYLDVIDELNIKSY